MFRDGTLRLLVFRLGRERFGMALSAVDEVIEAPSVQPLPDAASAVLGLAMLRGEPITVYDAGRLLHVARSGERAGALLLFQRDGRRIGLAIDDVEDAMLVEEQEVRALPGVEASDRTLVGVVRRSSDLVAILDADAVLDLTLAVVSINGWNRLAISFREPPGTYRPHAAENRPAAETGAAAR